MLKNAGPRVRWRSEPDKGQSDAINKAFAQCKGSIVGWLNSDDAYFDKEAIASVVNYFSGHHDVDILYGHAIHADADGRLIGVMWVPRFSYRRLRWHCFIVQPAVFFRREAIRGPLVDERFDFAMDWELWLRLGIDRQLARIDRVLAIDRDQPNRKTRVAAKTKFVEDEEKLRALYGVGRPPRPFRWLIGRAFAVQRRLMGALKIGEVSRARLAFDGLLDTGALLKRQLLVRRSRWHE